MAHSVCFCNQIADSVIIDLFTKFLDVKVLLRKVALLEAEYFKFLRYKEMPYRRNRIALVKVQQNRISALVYSSRDGSLLPWMFKDLPMQKIIQCKSC